MHEILIKGEKLEKSKEDDFFRAGLHYFDIFLCLLQISKTSSPE